LRGKSANKKLVGGVWYKQCTGCGKFLPLTAEYFYRRHQRDGRGDGFSAKCKSCADTDNAGRSRKYRAKITSLAREVVYFIMWQELDAIKIGFTSNLVHRFRALKVSLPGTMSVMGVISGGAKLEKSVQNLFKELHIRGEWYRATIELIDWIEKYTEKPSSEEQRLLGNDDINSSIKKET